MWKNDIALVKLERDVPSGIEDLPRIQKITLNSAGNAAFPPAGHVCYMKGWGCTDNGSSQIFRVFYVILVTSLMQISDLLSDVFRQVSVLA